PEAKNLGAQQFHAQVSGNTNSYVEWAKRLYALGDKHGIETVVKIPLVPNAIAQIGAVKALGGKILVTACYHANQGTIASAVEADFIAPYVGRMAAAGLNTDEHMQQLVGLRDHARHQFEILCGSIKTADEIAELGAIGIDSVTISPEIAHALVNNSKSLTATEDFERAAAAATATAAATH
ncbi:MAG: transaldolase family protein, partial [Rhizobiaceae bacterium]